MRATFEEIVMNPVRHIRRLADALAGLAGVLLAFASAEPAAFASGQAPPPEAASRIASTPQVGASSHEIGRTQPGSSASGTRKPAISQTGYSSRFPSAQAVR